MKKRRLLNKRCLLVITTVLILAGVGTANASVTLSSVDGSWSNTVGGTGVNYPVGVVVGYGNGLEDQVRWGDPAEFAQSGLGFTGVAPPSMSFEIGDAFEIGQLRHFNNPIWSGSAATSTDLAVSLVFSDPAGLSGTFNFTFDIDETDNSPGPPASDDIITFPSAYAQETFDIGGTLYTLQILGFGPDADHLVSSFRSPEGGTNSTLLFGKITTPAVIPAPGAIVLGSIGISLVGWLRRKKTL